MSENKTTEYITISVAEYHFLTKAATMLEVMMNADPYNREVLMALQKTINDMKTSAEAGAAE